MTNNAEIKAVIDFGSSGIKGIINDYPFYLLIILKQATSYKLAVIPRKSR